MVNVVRLIELGRLVGHPENPNVMSVAAFKKLVRNIKRSGRYEPLIVRPHPERRGVFEIISGHHRCKALERLGYEAAECVVWEVDDVETGIMLATFNRLGGRDNLGRKVALLKRLGERMSFAELGRLLPQTAGQMERLMNLKRPGVPKRAESRAFAHALVFFVDAGQERAIREALSVAERGEECLTRAARNAAALTHLARSFMGSSGATRSGGKVGNELCNVNRVVKDGGF